MSIILTLQDHLVDLKQPVDVTDEVRHIVGVAVEVEAKVMTVEIITITIVIVIKPMPITVLEVVTRLIVH